MYQEPPAWTDEPAGTFITPPEKVTAPASTVQISFMLSLKSSASQPILIVCSPRSSVASWNVLAPHPTAELSVHVGSMYSGYTAWASMSAFRVTFRTPLEYVRDVIASGHICGTGEESHAWKSHADHIVAPDGSFRMIVLFATRTSKLVVEKATENVGDGGAVGIAIVSLMASSRNSYVAPGIFAWWNVAPRRVTDTVVGPSVS